MKPRRTTERDLARAFSRYVLDVDYDGWEHSFSRPLALRSGDRVHVMPDSVVVADRAIIAVGVASSEGRWYFKEKSE